MSRYLITLDAAGNRARAVDWCKRLPVGTRVEFKQPKRSLPQNDKLWALLTDVARQIPWHGLKLTPDNWKLIFLDSLKHELRIVPNIDGTGFINLGRSSSDLSKEEFSNLIELIFAFGANHGVVWSDPALRSILQSAEERVPA